LLLFFVGLVAIIRDPSKRASGYWILLNLSALLIIRALPGTPVHDGVRLFCPVFPFLAMIAGIGGATLWSGSLCPAGISRLGTFRQRTGIFRISLSRISLVGIYLMCLFNLFWYAPQWLSFYNPIVGGLSGAVRVGMEPTYYWDGLDNEVLDWLKKNTKDGEKMMFSIHSRKTLQLYRLEIPFDVSTATTTYEELTSGEYRYYILQLRPSGMFERDVQIRERKKTVFTKTIRNGGWGFWNLGSVPIIEIYDVSFRE
jgi:hypothetical protein